MKKFSQKLIIADILDKLRIVKKNVLATQEHPEWVI